MRLPEQTALAAAETAQEMSRMDATLNAAPNAYPLMRTVHGWTWREA
jgi:hypothetical protein